MASGPGEFKTVMLVPVSGVRADKTPFGRMKNCGLIQYGSRKYYLLHSLAGT